MNMELGLSIEERDNYLLIQVEGEWTRDSIKLGMEDVAREAKERGYTHILLDIRKLSTPKKSFYRFLAGEYAAEVWSDPVKLRVAVFRNEVIDKFGENAAKNRGADLIVVSDIDEALAWLLESSA